MALLDPKTALFTPEKSSFLFSCPGSMKMTPKSARKGGKTG